MSKCVTVYTQAYNVENYIEQCIKSVLSQTFQDFEWILVENGSTDKTREIIRKYAALDERIKPDYFDVNQDGFTNYYIAEKADGRYIVKIDSDDWIEPEYLEKLIAPFEDPDVDISICGAVNYEEETGRETPHEYGELDGVYSKSDIEKQFIEMRSYMGTYWGKMFRREIFCSILPDMKEIGEKLKKGDNFGGDVAFALCYLGECKKLAFVNERMYHYRIHNNSYATRTIGTNRVFSCLALRETEHHFLHNVNAYTEQNVIMVDLLFWQNIEQLFKNIIRADWDTDQKIKTISEVCANKDLQLLRKEAYNSKVRTILMGDIAWCYMNAGNSKYLKNVLMLLEPDIFDSISNETYEWMRENQILMSYIIMGEFDNAKRYMEEITTGNNVDYIRELQQRMH